MKTILIVGLALLAVSAQETKKQSTKQQNILFIISDDLGYNDPSFRGNNQILTPNIDALTYQSVILNRYYTGPLCTPSRAALMSGKYAHRVGMQNNVLWNHQPWGLGLEHKLWPEYLREAGYRTHALGKWHIGHHQPQYLPTSRGFDTHWGYVASACVDYFTHSTNIPQSNFPGNNFTTGFDIRNNLDIDRSRTGQYLTDAITDKAVEIIQQSDEKPFFLYLAHLAMHRATDEDPLQAKPEDLAFFSHITNPRRRTYAAMVKAFDDGVGRVIEALVQAGKLDETIVVITTDNGGPTAIELAHPNTASNWPLRGMKGLAWEGGIRVDASVYAPSLPSGVVREDKIHITDWLQTVNSLANAQVTYDRKFDGMDLSKMITDGQGPYRHDVETIDQYMQTTSLISGKWKLMNSTFAVTRGLPDTWLGTNDQIDRLADQYVDIVLNSKAGVAFRNPANDPNPLTAEKIVRVRANLRLNCNDKEVNVCDILNRPCLYEIDEDPCERWNLAENPAYADELQSMKDKLAHAMKYVVERRNRPGDFAAEPTRFGGVWTPWQSNSRKDTIESIDFTDEPFLVNPYAF